MDRLPNCMRAFNLAHNNLDTMTGVIGRFQHLHLMNLDMSHNKLTEVPDTINDLAELETLYLRSNRICRLPASTLNLLNLKQVDLSGNCIVEFPLMFCGLRQLEVLNLSKNKLTHVPDAASALHVIELNLNHNEITALSDKLAECPRLRTLRLEGNRLQLDAVPSRILKDSKVSTLTLDGNLFETKKLVDVEGYNEYMERNTAVKEEVF